MLREQRTVKTNRTSLYIDAAFATICGVSRTTAVMGEVSIVTFPRTAAFPLWIYRMLLEAG
jgi:hypothetical protein